MTGLDELYEVLEAPDGDIEVKVLRGNEERQLKVSLGGPTEG